MNKKIHLVLEVNGLHVTMKYISLDGFVIMQQLQLWQQRYGFYHHKYRVYYDMESKMNDINFIPFILK